MEEGERLSKKQMVLEGTIKKLRAAAKESAAQKSAVDEALAQQQLEAAAAKLQLEQATAALQARRRCAVRQCFAKGSGSRSSNRQN